MKKKWILAPGCFALLLAPAGAAAAPTLLSTETGHYCYDFNNYIPSTDTPVVGGWMTYSTFSPGTRPSYQKSGKHYAYFFGRSCTNSPVGSEGWHEAGDSWMGAPWGTYDSTPIIDRPPTLVGSCPKNTAVIKVNHYLRSDGVWMSPPASVQPGGGGLEYSTNSAVYLCVKTDTTS